jgi:hypothetical protein
MGYNLETSLRAPGFEASNSAVMATRYDWQHRLYKLLHRGCPSDPLVTGRYPTTEGARRLHGLYCHNQCSQASNLTERHEHPSDTGKLSSRCLSFKLETELTPKWVYGTEGATVGVEELDQGSFLHIPISPEAI